jgi:hypothetical protein
MIMFVEEEWQYVRLIPNEQTLLITDDFDFPVKKKKIYRWIRILKITYS